MARPRFKPAADNRNAVEKMAALSLSEDKIANVIGIDPKTLRKYFSVEMKTGVAKGEVNLRQKAYQMAMDGDRVMLKYLLEKADAKHNRGHQQDGSGEPVSRSEVYAKLTSALARRAAEVQSRKLRSEQLSSSGAESQCAVASHVRFYRSAAIHLICAPRLGLQCSL
jgi:hypothetical protein